MSVFISIRSLPFPAPDTDHILSASVPWQMNTEYSSPIFPPFGTNHISVPWGTKELPPKSELNISANLHLSTGKMWHLPWNINCDKLCLLIKKTTTFESRSCFDTSCVTFDFSTNWYIIKNLSPQGKFCKEHNYKCFNSFPWSCHVMNNICFPL